MEALSPTMEEGRLVEWKKREGDPVAQGDVLAEVETDKAVMELVARADGVLLKHAVAEGTTVPVGALVAVIGAAGEDVSALLGGAAPAGAAGNGAPAPAGVAPAAATAAAPAPPPVAAEPVAAAAGRLKASPLARRLATEQGIDLRLVRGTGPEGRIVQRDVEQAVATGTAALGAAAAATAAPVSLPLPAAPGGFTEVPLTPMRKAIAKRLTASLGPIPTFYLTAEADMERVAEAREALNASVAPGEAKVSFNDIIVKAVALALRQHPACNAWWTETAIRQWHDVHIGMAVAIDDGLITPVIRSAHAKPLARIAAEARDLAARARARKLAPEEYTGSTFSISNLGIFDIDDFTAVINPPEAAILAVGRIAAKPVARDGAVVVRRMLRLTLSCDHRVIDGATGAQFLRTVTQMLANPLAML